MLKNLFRSDSPLMIVMTQITDCVFLSLFWILCCFPVVTVGASCAALYDGIFRALRQGEKNSWQRFFHTFRENWKAGILPTVVFGCVLGLVGWGMIQIWNAAVYGSISWMAFAAAALVAMLVIGMLSILFPMLSRFENTCGALLKNTVLLSLAKLPLTLALGFLYTICVFLCIRFAFPILFLPGLAALLSSWLIEPMFRPYMPETTEEEAAG